MEQNKPIFWHQGLFLQPQHFQLMEGFIKYRTSVLAQYGFEHFWGVAAININEVALKNGTFEIRSVKLIFQNGSIVEVPSNAIIEARSFAKSWTQSDKPMIVYLGVKKYSSNENNVSIVTDFTNLGDINSRFVTKADPDDVKDIYREGPSARIKSMYYHLRIFWEGEQAASDTFDLVPVAKLVRDGDKVRISEKFLAPALVLAGSPGLVSMIKDIRDEIASRIRQLETYKPGGSQGFEEFQPIFIKYIGALTVLNGAAPAIFHAVDTQTPHPYDMYLLLRGLIGGLSTFSDRVNMLGEMDNGKKLLTEYHHGDSYPAFNSAKELLFQLLDEIAYGPSRVITLEKKGDYFAAAIPADVFEKRNRFYIVFVSALTGDELAMRVMRESKLGPSSQIDDLVARALPGVELIPLPGPPQGLPRRANATHFRVEQMSEQWENIEEELSISFHWAGAPQDVKIELVVVSK